MSKYSVYLIVFIYIYMSNFIQNLYRRPHGLLPKRVWTGVSLHAACVNGNHAMICVKFQVDAMTRLQRPARTVSNPEHLSPQPRHHAREVTLEQRV